MKHFIYKIMVGSSGWAKPSVNNALLSLTTKNIAVCLTRELGEKRLIETLNLLASSVSVLNGPAYFQQYKIRLINIFLFQEDAPRPVKKGLLWQQKDKFFSRWKERYFILTEDYLQCFKKENSKISEMGSFLTRVIQ